MSAPGWLRRCVCGQVAATFYCDECQAYAMDYPADENLVDAWKLRGLGGAESSQDDARVTPDLAAPLTGSAPREPRTKSALQQQLEQLAAQGKATTVAQPAHGIGH